LFLQAAWTQPGVVSLPNDSRFEYFFLQMKAERIAALVIRCEQQAIRQPANALPTELEDTTIDRKKIHGRRSLTNAMPSVRCIPLRALARSSHRLWFKH